MRITFINRSPQHLKPATELAAINAHRAHLRHDRKHKAVKTAAQRLNVHILSHVDNGGDCSNDADPSSTALVLSQHIGGLRDDPFWSLPVANTNSAMTGFDYHFQVMCPLALGLGNYNHTQHQIMRINVLETAMYCSAMIAFDLVMQSLHLDNTQRVTQAAMFHMSTALTALRQALTDPIYGTSDIVLATIFPIAVVYVRVFSLTPVRALGGVF